jgi:hypothetical protein
VKPRKNWKAKKAALALLLYRVYPFCFPKIVLYPTLYNNFEYS